ncbi:MAG: radical SAM family heme chaperone HemW [Flavobacteriales bacterium]
MAGIYIHIPFCKQACYYCDFHFSTSLKNKKTLIDALKKELVLRKNELDEPIETIYFGGGTPSLLKTHDIQLLIHQVYENYPIIKQPEITLEANPDDLSLTKIKELSKTKINRLSIGVQSFFEEDLKLMNRAHNATEALQSIKNGKKYFDNITIDLIYGIPKMSLKRWQQNLEIAIELQVPHISAYALTVEPKTALKKMIETHKIPAVDDELSKEHYEFLVHFLSSKKFVNYEFSNFGKKGYFSKNNTAYWSGKAYLGIGPSAHSFNKKIRSWNIANNIKYIRSLEEDKLPSNQETLSKTDCYNEYIMTHLRTITGVSIKKIEQEFGELYLLHLQKESKNLIEKKLLTLKKSYLHITAKGKFLSDSISSKLFFLD